MNSIKKFFSDPYIFALFWIGGGLIGYFTIGTPIAGVIGVALGGACFIVLDIIVTLFIIS